MVAHSFCFKILGSIFYFYLNRLNSSSFSLKTTNKFNSINVNSLCRPVRYFSSLSSHRRIHSYRDVTKEEINKLLENQGVSISEEELKKLKSISGVRFDLPINDQTKGAFGSLVGKPKGRSWKSGVYIFTHKATGNSYVGSSNNLSRRLDQYFTFKHFNKNNSGLLLPLIKKEGFQAFSLEIFVMPEELATDYYFLFLEQYYILTQNYKLNTQQIVNFRVNQGKNVFLYDLEGKILYYSAKSYNQLQGNLGIHFNTYTNCIKKGDSYLKLFKLTHTPIDGAIKSYLTLEELQGLIAEKQAEYNRSKGLAMRGNLLSSNPVTIPITLKDVVTGDVKSFPSIVAGVSYLVSINVKVNRFTVAKRVKDGKLYQGYIFSAVES